MKSLNKFLLLTLTGLTLNIGLGTNCFAVWLMSSGAWNQNYYYNCFAASGNNFFMGADKLYLSTDNGITWAVATPSGLTNTNILSFATSGSNIFAGTTGGGVFLSTDNGNNWVAVNNGLPANATVCTLVISGSNIFAGTLGKGIFLSNNNGSKWVAVNNGLPANTTVYSLIISGSNMFAGTDNNGVFLSADNGNKWTAVNNGFPVNTTFGTTSTIWTFAISGNKIFAGTYGEGLFLSTDNGNKWVAVKNGFTGTEVGSILVSGSNIFAGTYDGIFLSTDNGNKWVAVSDGLPAKTGVKSLTINGSNLFMGTWNNGVWDRPLSEMITTGCTTPTITLTGNTATASTTGTYQWLNCATNALITNATGKSYTATTNGNYKVIVTNGICKDTSACKSITINGNPSGCTTPTITFTGNTATASTTGSYQWLNCANNAPITNATGKSYTATSNGNYKVIVTNGTCKDTSACISITITGIQQQMVNNELSVYPNPNNGKFIIASSDLQIKTIEIYSVLGELVLTENLTANNIVIDISEQPKGIYFYKISSENNTVKTGKLIMQ